MSPRPAQIELCLYLGTMRWRIRFILLRIAAVILAALHARLLWQRVEDLSITNPEVLARWCVAALAAVAGLLLLHFRVSWRSWVVFWTVIVLLHAAAPVQHARFDVFLEAVFAFAPLMVLAIGGLSPIDRGKASFLDCGSFALPIALLGISLPSRAPPLR